MKKVIFFCLFLSTLLFSQVVINEIHYNPATSQGNDSDYEFLELFNIGPDPVDLNGWTVGSDDTSPASLDGVFIDGNGFVVVAYNGATYAGLDVPVVDNDGYFGLGNSGKNLLLINGSGTTVDQVSYDDSSPWPSEADGDGPSLELMDPLSDNNLAESWAASEIDGGTPGAANSVYVEPGDNYPPVADAGEDQIVVAGEIVTLDATGSSDIDGEIIFYEWTQLSGIFVDLSDNESAITTFTAPEADDVLLFQVTVYDNLFESDTDEVEVTICSGGLISIAEARNLAVGSCAVVQGVVTSPNFQTTNSEFTIQDETAGIVLFQYGLDLIVNYGDLVEVIGTIDDYNGKLEIIAETPADVTNLGPSDLPEPQILTVSEFAANGEEYESEMITVVDVFLDSGSWPSEGSSANLTITDGISTTIMRIDSDTDIDGSTEPVWPVNVTAVGGQYYDYQVMPRFVSDFEETGGNQIPVADAGDDQFVDAGGTVTLDGLNSYDPDGSIVGYIWEQIDGPTVILSDYEEPVVTFTAPDENASVVFRLTVADDLGAIGTDEVSIIVISEEITIYDIQFTDNMGSGDDCFPTPFSSQLVTTTGIVTAVKPGSSPNFYIQDPAFDSWAGVYVFDNTIDPNLGDEITISAEVVDYFGVTELQYVVGYAINSAGNTVDPLNITTGDLGLLCSESGEAYEGMLVRVSNVTVESTNEYNSWYINDGSGTTKVDDYFFEGSWQVPNDGDVIESVAGIVHYYYGEYVIYPRNDDDFVSDDCNADGDVNLDGSLDVLDVVAIVGYVLGTVEFDSEQLCQADVNADGDIDVLDIVMCVGWILTPKISDFANEAVLYKTQNSVSISGNGLIGGIQMTLKHGTDFVLELTENAYLSDYSTVENQTTLIVIYPKNELFTAYGDFEIAEVIAASNTDYIDVNITESFLLMSNYPNPFNPVTTINYSLAQNGDVELVIYDLLGNVISTLVNSYQAANSYQVNWNGTNANNETVPSGIYFARLTNGNDVITHKLTLLR